MLTYNAAGTNQHNKKEVRVKMLPEPTFDKTACRTRELLGEEYHISHAIIHPRGLAARFGRINMQPGVIRYVEPLVPSSFGGSQMMMVLSNWGSTLTSLTKPTVISNISTQEFKVISYKPHLKLEK